MPIFAAHRAQASVHTPADRDLPAPRLRAPLAVALALTAAARPASAEDSATPGYPERVVQWGVQKGETCEDIAAALYGSPKHTNLLGRYNRITCRKGVPLTEGMTLVLPEKVTSMPNARIRSLNPDVKERPPGGSWSLASSGMPLYSNHNVNTLESGRADIEFIDRSRVFLAANTLVVIYGTAGQTSVSKTPPPVVEVEAGEVKAGLAALRGGSVEVALKGGGRVSVASRDAVVERKGERTTVAVFDGKASVSSGGANVEVPKNFGTRFVGVAKPAPPRPLPPAPEWEKGSSEGIVLAPKAGGQLVASWSAVPNAASYRFEIARDEDFRDLVAREEIPGSVRSFRAEKMPPGTYHLSVRAIDKDDYLGIAQRRAVHVVAGSLTGSGVLDQGAMKANPYGVLELTPSPGLEMAIDKGPFGPVPPSLDLRQRAPKVIRLRAPGAAAEETIEVAYLPVTAAVSATPSPDRKSLRVIAKLAGAEGIDLEGRIAPSVRVHLPGGMRQAKLAASGPSVGEATVPITPVLPPGAPAIRIDVMDGRGRLLGSTDADIAQLPPPPPAPPLREPPRIGVTLPPWHASSVTNVPWWSPTAPGAAGAVVSAGYAADAWGAQAQARASGSVGPVGIDAQVSSNALGSGAPVDAAAWLGARARLYRRDPLASLEIGPALRVGLPMSADSPPARLEAGLGIGGVAGRFTWLADAGVRARLDGGSERPDVPPWHGFLLAGATVDPAAWMRAYALVDAHLLFGEPLLGRGGVSLGAEAGGAFFGALSVRASPWSDTGDILSMQLGVGLRETFDR